MNADLHMADDLKNTGKGNLFVIFGEPDIEILDPTRTDGQMQVKVKGVDVFNPNTGEVAATAPTASPAGSSTPTTTRRASSSARPTSLARTIPTTRSRPPSKPRSTRTPGPRLHSDTSRPFDKPKLGRIAVKVINHLGDEVMKVLRVA